MTKDIFTGSFVEVVILKGLGKMTTDNHDFSKVATLPHTKFTGSEFQENYKDQGILVENK